MPSGLCLFEDFWLRVSIMLVICSLCLRFFGSVFWRFGNLSIFQVGWQVCVVFWFSVVHYFIFLGLLIWFFCRLCSIVYSEVKSLVLIWKYDCAWIVFVVNRALLIYKEVAKQKHCSLCICVCAVLYIWCYDLAAFFWSGIKIQPCVLKIDIYMFVIFLIKINF